MATPPATSEPVTPSRELQQHVRAVQRVLESDDGRAELVGADGTRMILPEPLYRLLVRAVRELEQGRAVSGAGVPRTPLRATQEPTWSAAREAEAADQYRA